jgi:uncharacterized membrane protein YbhN (UPF0104 family)
VTPVPASLSSFIDSVGQFFSSLAEIDWLPMFLALALFGVYLTVLARAYYNILRAAYPGERFPFRKIWAAYVAGYGINNVIPARAGDIVQLYLVKTSVPGATYSTVAASFLPEGIFDITIGIVVLGYAFTQGVFPKPPDFSQIDAFDISFFASNPDFTLFVLTALGVLAMVAFALLSRRVKAFWARVRQGISIVFDRRRYFREVYLVQFGAWLIRFASLWFLLDAFHIGGSVRNVLLVLGVNAVASFIPFVPGGAGVQQALLVQVFAGVATAETVAAYSVGQQVAIAAVSFGLGFAGLVFVFRIRSIREVRQRGRDDRAAEAAAKEGVPLPASSRRF